MSHHIPRAQLQRVIDDVPFLRDNLGTTRSQSKANANTPHDAPQYDAHHLDESFQLADQSVCEPLTDHEPGVTFSRELAEWGKLNAYRPVNKTDISHEDSSIIGSHIIYKRKLDGSSKARIVPWGQRDKDKDTFVVTPRR